MTSLANSGRAWQVRSPAVKAQAPMLCGRSRIFFGCSHRATGRRVCAGTGKALRRKRWRAAGRLAAGLPAAQAALEEQAVGDLHQGGAGRGADFLEGGVDQVDVDHLTLQAGFLAIFQQLDPVTEAEWPGGENLEGAEDVGQHAPGSE